MTTTTRPTHRGPALNTLVDCTEAQQQAITHVEGPLLIIAAAGSGKTRVVTRRIAHLLEQGVPDDSVLGITFTNKAANEMAQRVYALVGHSRVTLSTFHAFCARLLRMYGPRAGIGANFTIYDRDDCKRILRDIYADLRLDAKNFSPARVIEAISCAKRVLQSADEYADSAHGFYRQAVHRVYAAYEARLATANALDFDDLLVRTARMLQQDQELLERLQNRYRFILVDEYQDTNHAQYLITNLLARKHRNLCVTGDPDQSIYGWRGADISNILDFEEDYPEARVIKLEQNWRSTKSILAVADAVIRNNRNRKAKKLWTENEEGPLVQQLVTQSEVDEADEIARRIARLIREGVPPAQIAIFYRVNALSRVYERGLRERGIPYRIVAGTEFFQRREVKDVLAYLRLAVNEDDDASFLRVVNVPARGIGAVTVKQIKAVARKDSKSLMAAVRSHVIGTDNLSKRATQKLTDFAGVIDVIREAAVAGPRVMIERALVVSGYRAAMAHSKAQEDLDRAANLDELVNAASEFEEKAPEATMAGFLEQVALVSDVDTLDPDAGTVSLMTIHSAKGLEFDCVFVVAVEQHLLPHVQSSQSLTGIEEERRLCYVAMTRARKRLVLSRAEMRKVEGRDARRFASDFLKEIPSRLLETIDMTAVGRDELEYVGGHDATENAPFMPGDRVLHPKYGIGDVTALIGRGDSLRAEVTFGNLGTRRFVVRNSQLEKIRRSLGS